MKFPYYVLWALVALAQLPVLLHQWMTPDLQLKRFIWVPPAAIQPQSDPIPELELSASTEASVMLQVMERPLFSPTRRPPPPPKPPPPPEPPDLLATANILGFYGEGATAGALVEADGRVQRVKPGDAVVGWMLKRVNAQSAEFERGTETRELRITRKRVSPRNAGSSAAETSTAISNAEEDTYTRKEKEAVRNSVRQMNARRASIGLPPLPEP